MKNYTRGMNIRLFTRQNQTLLNGTSVALGTSQTASRTQSFTGVQLPAHKALIKDVRPASTPMTSTRFTVKSKSSRVQTVRVVETTMPTAIIAETVVTNRSSTYAVTGIPTTPPAFSGSSYNTAYNKAVSKLYDQIRNFESHANVGEDLGEISQTVRLLGKPLSGIQNLLAYSIRNHLSLLKKARWNNLKQIARGLGSTVVEYRYGIEPLINTLAEATVSLQNRDRLAFYSPFRAVGRDTTETLQPQAEDVYGTARIFWSSTIYQEHKVMFEGVFGAESQPDQYSYAQSLGLTWREALPTLYNLIPYSFLLDYVVNLNQFIESVAVPWGSVRWCNMTERSSNRRLVVGVKGGSSTSHNVRSFTSGFLDTKATGVRRSDHSSGIPLPHFAVKRPSNRHLVNTASLLAANLPVIGNLTRALLKNKKTKDLDRHFTDINRDYKLRVPYPRFTY
jgi:hypothetical protein